MMTYSNTELVQILREELDYSLCELRASQRRVREFHSSVEQLHICEWPQEAQQLFDTLKKREAAAQRSFLRAHAALLAQNSKFPDPSPAPAPSPEPAPEPKSDTKENPDEVPDEHKVGVQQTIRVTVVDGKTVSRTQNPAEFWLERPSNYFSHYTRHFHFPDAVVPPEYDYVNEHEGKRYKSTQDVCIHYLPAEFLRLCQLEVDTGSPHMLDGERVAYTRLRDSEPISDSPAENTEESDQNSEEN